MVLVGKAFGQEGLALVVGLQGFDGLVLSDLEGNHQFRLQGPPELAGDDGVVAAVGAGGGGGGRVTDQFRAAAGAAVGFQMGPRLVPAVLSVGTVPVLGVGLGLCGGFFKGLCGLLFLFGAAGFHLLHGKAAAAVVALQPPRLLAEMQGSGAGRTFEFSYLGRHGCLLSEKLRGPGLISDPSR